MNPTIIANYKDIDNKITFKPETPKRELIARECNVFFSVEQFSKKSSDPNIIITFAIAYLVINPFS